MGIMKRAAVDEVRVDFATDAFGESDDTLAKMLRAATGQDRPRVFLAADANVVHYNEGLGSKIGRYFSAQNLELAGRPVIMGGGERVKNVEAPALKQVLSAAAEARVGAGDCMLVLGGGVLCDVAGFAAGQMFGGLATVRVPTTPGAMLGAAFETCASMNAGPRKDVYGIRLSPAGVLIDLSFAKSVLEGVWRGGYPEALRFAAVSDAALFKKLVKGAADYGKLEMSVLETAVRGCVASRCRKGAAQFGLWAALRLQEMSGFKLPHGYSLALGIRIDAAYARLKGLLSEENEALLAQALADCGAAEGAAHSMAFLRDVDALLNGLEAWRIRTGNAEIELPDGFGKRTMSGPVDLEAMRQAINLVK